MKITIELTDEEIGCILETAETYSGYWAQTKGGLARALKEPVEVRDRENSKEVLGVLTREGLHAAASKFHGAVREDLFAQLVSEPEAIDAEAADAYVQVALFGEIRYG